MNKTDPPCRYKDIDQSCKLYSQRPCRPRRFKFNNKSCYSPPLTVKEAFSILKKWDAYIDQKERVL